MPAALVADLPALALPRRHDADRNGAGRRLLLDVDQHLPAPPAYSTQVVWTLFWRGPTPQHDTHMQDGTALCQPAYLPLRTATAVHVRLLFGAGYLPDAERGTQHLPQRSTRAYAPPPGRGLYLLMPSQCQPDDPDLQPTFTRQYACVPPVRGHTPTPAPTPTLRTAPTPRSPPCLVSHRVWKNTQCASSPFHYMSQICVSILDMSRDSFDMTPLRACQCPSSIDLYSYTVLPVVRAATRMPRQRRLRVDRISKLN